jgi:hypothetical protein
MGPFWARLLACERKIERYRQVILDLKRQLLACQQQLRDQRGS